MKKNYKATAKVNNQGYGCLIKRQLGVYETQVSATGFVYNKNACCMNEDEAKYALADFVNKMCGRLAA